MPLVPVRRTLEKVRGGLNRIVLHTGEARSLKLDSLTWLVLQARPAGVSFEAANPRHAHEWKVFEEVKVLEEKVLIPGVLDSTTNFIEHPELVAQRIERFASLVGRERVIAGTDCGFATFSDVVLVDPDIAWAKLKAMTEGASIASRRLWPAAMAASKRG